MKKLLIIIGISLVSFNLHAVEHVFGIGGGGQINILNKVHEIITSYPNPNYDPNSEKGLNQYEILYKRYNKENTIKEYSLFKNLEYQIRFLVDAEDSQAVILGVGYNNKVYGLFMISPFYLEKLRWNFGISANYIENNKIDYYIVNDIEHAVGNFMLYSRLSIGLNSKINDSYDTTNISIINNPSSEDTIVKNRITTRQNYQGALSFGIRYKI
ncbi:MAG: hypothetical protein FWE18_00240 [Alphaproteobacteria bacterium]|nr:hypothetical protein [Alphaproteobacteria bacterium]